MTDVYADRNCAHDPGSVITDRRDPGVDHGLVAISVGDHVLALGGSALCGMADGVLRSVRFRFVQEIEKLLSQCLFAPDTPKLGRKAIPMGNATFQVNANHGSLYLVEEKRLDRVC
jgi:hypothetical protein